MHQKSSFYTTTFKLATRKILKRFHLNKHLILLLKVLAHHKKPEKTTDILRRHLCFPAKSQTHTKPPISMCDLVPTIAL